MGLFVWLPASAETLRYQGKAESRFSFRFDIRVEGDDETTMYRGMTHYTVESADEQQLQLVYQGGLTESKQVQRRGGRFPSPRSLRFPSIPSPFSRPTFLGKTQTTNEITLSTRGEALAMKGTSQLPYLLGHVSLLPFEPLPEEKQDAWSTGSGVSITQKADRRRLGGPFGPLGPFAANELDDKNVQAASEVSQYKIVSESNKQIQIHKTYHLKTPQTKDNLTFEMSGEGTWTYNTLDHMPAASDMQIKLIVDSGKVQTTVPIHLKFERVSQEEVAQIEAERKRVAEEKRLAKEKADEEARRPLSSEEVAAALIDLQSEDTDVIHSRLLGLAKKKPKQPNSQIVDAIRPLVNHEVKQLSRAAHQAMLRWSPEYKVVSDLESAYQRPAPVTSTGREVDSRTPLFVGQIVQVQEHGSFWFPAEVLSLLDDGKVTLRRRGGGRRTMTLSRRNIQLAPEELPQPNQSAEDQAEASSSRVWSDASGRFRVQAVLLRIENTQAVLRRSDGKEISVPIDKLSQADQKYLSELAGASDHPENPFQ